MIMFSGLSALALGTVITCGTLVGFFIGFLAGYAACEQTLGRHGRTVIGALVVLIVIALALVFGAGCAPVIHEKVTITDVEREVPVPGDTLTVEGHSDSLVVEGPAPSWYPQDPDSWLMPRVETPATIWPSEAIPPVQKQIRVRAHVDTTIGATRVRAWYMFPEDRWRFLVERAETSVSIRQRDTSGMRIVPQPYEVTPWWVPLALIVAALAVLWSVFEKVKR